MSTKNTLQKGSVRYIVFSEDDTWYAVGLELNIMESGDTPQEALLLLWEAIQGYIESARKIKASVSTLNQETDPEYERMWRTTQGKKKLDWAIEQNIFAVGQVSLSGTRELIGAKELVPA